ncbi:MAG: hypothetical protein AAGA30_20910, partial [Planctomycetota bacterium]
MASPIRWFRKYSQFFIVVFGVFLMAIFGLGGVVSSLNPSDFAQGNEYENKVVATWSGGEIKEDELYFLRQRHFATQRFLGNVYKYAVNQNNGETFPLAVEQILPIIRPGEEPSGPVLDERILNRFLFAKRAEQEGFVIDDTMVYEYIAQYGGNTDITKNLLKKLNKQVNQQVSISQIVRHLKTELLWQQMESFTRGGLAFDPSPAGFSAISPTEAMQLYNRANRKIDCQVIPISVEQCVAEVNDEPKESE